MKITISNKVYNALKMITLIVLPAIATLYLSISKIWGLPYGPEITATITAICTCLGAFLQINTKSYNKDAKSRVDGVVDICEYTDGDKLAFTLKDDIYALKQKDFVTLSVKKENHSVGMPNVKKE